LGAKIGDLLKTTKIMHNFFTYIIVIFSELQVYAYKVYNYFSKMALAGGGDIMHNAEFRMGSLV
jgi:hypothetical protein